MENPPSSPPSRVHETRRARGEATPSRCSVHGVYGDDGPGGGWQIERDGANKGGVTKERAKGPGREEGGGRRGLKSSIARIFAVTSRKSCATALSLSLFLLSLFFWPRSQTEENWNDTSAPLLSLPLSDIFNFFLSPSPFAPLYLFPRQKSFFSLSLFSLSLCVELNAVHRCICFFFFEIFYRGDETETTQSLSERSEKLSGARFHVFSFSTSFGNAGTLSFSFPPVNQFLLPLLLLRPSYSVSFFPSFPPLFLLS